MHPLALTPDSIVEIACAALSAAVGGWSMGVQGAVAEFAVPGADTRAVAVRRSGRTVESRTAGGGLRLGVTDATRAFAVAGKDGAAGAQTVYLTVPRRALRRPAEGLSVTAGDPDALRHEHRRHLLVDLGVGHAAAAFCVRTGDPELGARLRALEGATWREILDDVGHELVAASPDRVVTTPLGRVEVYGPIPPAGGESPAGPHSHLLPNLLETGRELPDGLDLPAEFAPAAAFHAPPGWATPAG